MGRKYGEERTNKEVGEKEKMRMKERRKRRSEREFDRARASDVFVARVLLWCVFWESWRREKGEEESEEEENKIKVGGYWR